MYEVVPRQCPTRKRPAERIRQKFGTQVGECKTGLSVSCAREPHQFVDRLVLDAQPLQIHSEQFFALLLGGPGEFFRSSRAPDDSRIERCCPVRAKKNQNAAVVPTKVIDFLDYRVYRYLILVM